MIGHLEAHFFPAGAALFDHRTWRTHVLGESSALLLQAAAPMLVEHALGGQQPAAQAFREYLQHVLDLPADAPDLVELVTFLQELELID